MLNDEIFKRLSAEVFAAPIVFEDSALWAIDAQTLNFSLHHERDIAVTKDSPVHELIMLLALFIKPIVIYPISELERINAMLELMNILEISFAEVDICLFKPDSVNTFLYNEDIVFFIGTPNGLSLLYGPSDYDPYEFCKPVVDITAHWLASNYPIRFKNTVESWSDDI